MDELTQRLASLSAEKLDLLVRRHRRRAPGRAKDREIPAISRDHGQLPASFAQERFWFLDQLAPGNPAYTLTHAFTLPASLNLSLLRRSLDGLVRRHEALRTTFRDVDGRLMQVVSTSARATLDVVDLSFLPHSELEPEVRQYAAEEASRCFDLVAGPLFRATLLELGRGGKVLFLSMHHIISDAWSLRILSRELGELYESFARATPISLPPLRVQYADFASWQREQMRGEKLERLLEYWRARLSGAPPLLDLPTDRPRPNVQRFRGSAHMFELDGALSRRLRELAQGEGATLFMTLLALYQELLRRHSGQDDVLVGAPSTNRNRAELERVVGLFVNTLVLRGDLSGNPSFRELLRRVRVTTLDAYTYQDLPFEKLVEELQPQRDLGFNPLVQVAFGLQTAPATLAQPKAPEKKRGDERANAPGGNGTAKFDLSLVFNETADGLDAVLEYNSDLFEPDTVARIAEQFRTLAASVVANPDLPLSRLSLVSPREIERLTVTWARGPRERAERDLAEQVRAQARIAPTNMAVEAPDGELRYAELDRAADRLARRLRALGVSREVRVGVCLSNSLAMPVSFLAILRAGGAYLPLDPALPLARLRYLIADAGVQVLITDRAGEERLAQCVTRVVCVDADEQDEGEASRGITLPTAFDPDQLAYVIYTSGSTGEPKGAMLTRRGLCTLMAAQKQALRLGPGDRVLKFATPSFDASVFDIVSALGSGATLCLEKQDDLIPGPAFVDLLRQRRITAVTLPPSSLAVMPVEACPALRLLFVAGEACPAELVARWAPGRRMINGYGPTEATIWATFADCKPDGRTPAIGKPVANVSVYLLDRDLMPVPVGIPGEIYIGGPTLARGYLGRPDLTVASFVPDPWGEPGARLYRTGDVARFRADGNLEFLRRADAQVKIRGFRIEPGELEAALSALPEVAYAAAVVREETRGNPQLLAYVVPRAPSSVEAAAIRRTLESQLPRYLLPSKIIVLSELPRTPSGKVDRRALPRPQATPDDAPSPPQSSTEETVCRICAEVLKVLVGRNHNFFELGGHSLSAMQVVSRIREELGIEVPVRRLFEAATMAELCQGLGAATPRSKIRRLSRRPEVALR